MKSTVAMAVLCFTLVVPGFASDTASPKPSSSILPMYPERARMAHVAGTVKLWFVLNANGRVDRAELISGNPMLRDAALDVVKSWRFAPNALPENVRLETQFVFSLDVQSTAGEPTLHVSITDYQRVEVKSELYVKTIE